jgi:putative heme-binding domain-containing protein
VFRRPEVNCLGCHQVGAEGANFGPRLTEIGAKLGKEALAQAILEPDAGVSFGFETWRIELEDEELLGLISSETQGELTLKTQGDQVRRISTAEIGAREKRPPSLMPSGLHQSLSAQEFADLLEYLSSLRPGKGG